tara:strand:+ start:412 stop:630 length:219 start_codon:yes stop_codon:yes gene_type:complete
MFNNVEDLIEVYGWSLSSRLIYIINKHMIEGKSKQEIHDDVCNHKPLPLIKEKSFNVLWNRYERISDKVNFV